MAQPQPLTHQTGIVTHANDRGIRLNGEPAWLNVSRFRPVDLPPVGAHVAVNVQGDGWLAAVTVLDTDAADMPLARTRMAVAAPGSRERTHPPAWLSSRRLRHPVAVRSLLHLSLIQSARPASPRSRQT